MDVWERAFNRSLNDVKRGIRNLEKMGLRIEGHKTETMTGEDVTHIYVVDRFYSGRVSLQKHLFTIREVAP